MEAVESDEVDPAAVLGVEEQVLVLLGLVDWPLFHRKEFPDCFQCLEAVGEAGGCVKVLPCGWKGRREAQSHGEDD